MKRFPNIGIHPNIKGLNQSEWVWMKDHCFIDLGHGTEPTVGNTCIWWNEV